MDPTIKNGKQKINQVKKREPWRPFGASVKQDQAHRFFEMTDSPFMMYNTKVKYSGIPAVTHRDGTCRHNTVTPEMNPAYYELLDQFERLYANKYDFESYWRTIRVSRCHSFFLKFFEQYLYLGQQEMFQIQS